MRHVDAVPFLNKGPILCKFGWPNYVLA